MISRIFINPPLCNQSVIKNPAIKRDQNAVGFGSWQIYMFQEVGWSVNEYKKINIQPKFVLNT